MEEIGPMSGGRSSREKGMRAERQIVDLFRQVGLEAYRVPLSGISAGFKSDVEVRDDPPPDMGPISSIDDRSHT